MHPSNRYKLKFSALILATLFLKDSPPQRTSLDNDLARNRVPAGMRVTPEQLRAEEAAYARKRVLQAQHKIYGGLPKYSKPLILITNIGFIAAYDIDRKNPIWVYYTLKSKGPVGSHVKIPDRPSGFYADSRIPGVPGNFLQKSGYDSGHVAPNYAIASRYGESAQREASKVYNVVAMHRDVNRGLWKDFERIEADFFSNAFEENGAFAGPVFGAKPKYVGKDRVELPEAFYKIVIDEDSGKIRLLPVVMRQHPGTNETLVDQLKSARHVENITEINFFPDLSPALQDSIELPKPTKLWEFEKPKTPRNRR